MPSFESIRVRDATSGSDPRLVAAAYGSARMRIVRADGSAIEVHQLGFEAAADGSRPVWRIRTTKAV